MIFSDKSVEPIEEIFRSNNTVFLRKIGDVDEFLEVVDSKIFDRFGT